MLQNRSGQIIEAAECARYVKIHKKLRNLHDVRALTRIRCVVVFDDIRAGQRTAHHVNASNRVRFAQRITSPNESAHTTEIA